MNTSKCEHTHRKQMKYDIMCFFISYDNFYQLTPLSSVLIHAKGKNKHAAGKHNMQLEIVAV